MTEARNTSRGNGTPLRLFFACLGAMLAFLVSPSAAVASSATAEQGSAAISSDASVSPMGGCVLGVCGAVVNQSTEGFYVTMNWCCTDNRYLAPGKTTDGWGDVDGYQIPSGCRANVQNKISGSLQPIETVGAGWHKISTNWVTYVKSIWCNN
ncbi:hypothetical protein GA0074695_0622 [Micromonospora viridifaciens]|uniref:Secreted protein n=1 Tax=Micromonospora viridifaciens TaxID=1881 RepID=A0A1C4ULN2_MICVI|nr:hypothetical protein [Micromonospora viridifaciens]SCE72541.1 hypothetical protein GA0074695_0622 [Micromonospora viridifaciens]